MVLMGEAAYELSTRQLHYVNQLKKSTEAQYLAEAGLSDAVAVLTTSFQNKDDASKFPLKNLGSGTYKVTVFQKNGRVLLKSVGTVQNISRTASLEVEDLTPPALNYGEAAGGNIVLATIFGSSSNITGNLFANQNITLTATPFSSITINGDIFAGGTITPSAPTSNITWHSATPNAGNITFPNYDFNYYKTIAQANNKYYSASQSWTNQTFDLNSSGGVLFVDGDVTLYGNNTIKGALISTGAIRMYGTLNQQKTTNYPSYPAIMTSQQDILLLNLPFISSGRLFAAGLVYSGNNFKLLGLGTQASVTGSILAKGLLQQGQILSTLTIVYEHQNPPGLITSGGVNIKSYNT